MTDRHESSCSVYNAPAYEPGPCDCKYREQNERKSLAEMVIEAGRRPVSDRPDPYSDALIDRLTQNTSPTLDEAIEKGVEACMLSDQ